MGKEVCNEIPVNALPGLQIWIFIDTPQGPLVRQDREIPVSLRAMCKHTMQVTGEVLENAARADPCDPDGGETDARCRWAVHAPQDPGSLHDIQVQARECVRVEMN